MARRSLKILWITGTWHYILTRSVLAQQGETVTPEGWVILISGGRSSPAFLQRLTDLCQQGFPGVEVLPCPYQAAWHPATLRLLAELQQRRGARITDLWSCFPTEVQCRALGLLNPQARNWAIEDGLVTYAPSFTPLPRRRPRRLRQIAGQLLGPWLTSPRFLPILDKGSGWHDKMIRRLQFDAAIPVTRYFGLLDELVPDTVIPCPVEKLRPEFVQAEVEAYRRLIGYTPPTFTRPTVLFLGDNLPAIMGEAAEPCFELTLQWLRRIVDHGYQVVWKPHPRSEARHTERLVANFGPDELYRAPEVDMAPAEVAYAVPSLRAVVSMLSSACFYFPRYFGIPSYRFPLPREGVNLPAELQEVLALSEAHIPLVEDFLAQPAQA